MEKHNKKEMLTAYKERKVVGGICAVRNTVDGKMLLTAVADIQGYRNRYEFAKSTGSCVHVKLQKDWEKFGPDGFVFEVLEELVKKETQTPKEFSEDIRILMEIWLEKINPGSLY